MNLEAVIVGAVIGVAVGWLARRWLAAEQHGQMAYLARFGYTVLSMDQVLACLRGEMPMPPKAANPTRCRSRK